MGLTLGVAPGQETEGVRQPPAKLKATGARADDESACCLQFPVGRWLPESQPKPQSLDTDGGEERLAQQGVPDLHARGVVRPTEREVDIAEDPERLKQKILDGVATTQPASVADPPLSTKIGTLASTVEVGLSVVLVERAMSVDPQVSAGDELTGRHRHYILRRDATVDGVVEQAQHRLRSGLRSGIAEEKCLPQPWGATASEGGGPPDLSDRHASIESAVDEDHRVEQPEETRTAEQCLARYGDTEAVDVVGLRDQAVPRHDQLAVLRRSGHPGLGDEDRKPFRQWWQPPSPQDRGGQGREAGVSWDARLPRPRILRGSREKRLVRQHRALNAVAELDPCRPAASLRLTWWLGHGSQTERPRS